MSFACPHFDMARDYCLRLKTDCIPGRRGCVLAGSEFAVPPEVRVQEKAEEKQRERNKPLPTENSHRG